MIGKVGARWPFGGGVGGSGRILLVEGLGMRLCGDVEEGVGAGCI